MPQLIIEITEQQEAKLQSAIDSNFHFSLDGGICQGKGLQAIIFVFDSSPLLPFTKDGRAIFIGDTVYCLNPDRGRAGVWDEVLELKVVSISSNQGSLRYEGYDGDFCITAGDFEFGNLECYEYKANVPTP